MLSLQFIRENTNAVRKAVRDKNVAVDIDEVLRLDLKAKAVKTALELNRASKNQQSAAFQNCSPTERETLRSIVKGISAEISKEEAQLTEIEAQLKPLLLRIPNIPWDGAPVGPDENSNTVVRTHGEPRSFDFEPRDHVALLEMNDWAE
ncbi:MAG TPA: hypothetical protein VGB65_09220, partial [Allosphingosinicella sp.]